MDAQRNEIRRLHHVCAEYREEKKEGIRMLLEKFAGKLSLQEIITIAEGFSAKEYLKEEILCYISIEPKEFKF
jgi:hypothetical protein